MRLAILFSGQGGQRPEHLEAVREEASAEMAAALAAALPGPWTGLAADPLALVANAVAQPFIFGLEMIRWLRLRPYLPQPICAAGYSLGEMAACSAAGAFAPVAGIALCRQRAALMDAAAEGGMCAVLGLDDGTIVAIAEASGLAVAIRNGPRHHVLAGPTAALPRGETLALARGASRTVRLAVNTPSHTAAMGPAAAAFAQTLADLPDGRLDFPVLSAIDGQVARHRWGALPALARQIATPLDWAACLEAVVEMQPDAVLEIGPGNALVRLLGDIAPDLPARACDDFRSDAGILAWLGSLD